MRLPLIIAEGAGANQGALILVGLIAPFIAVGFGIRARLKKEGVSSIGIIVSLIALMPSAFVLHTFGLPWTWDYSGAYIPSFPLILSLLGLALSIQKSPTPATTDNDRGFSSRSYLSSIDRRRKP